MHTQKYLQKDLFYQNTHRHAEVMKIQTCIKQLQRLKFVSIQEVTEKFSM